MTDDALMKTHNVSVGKLALVIGTTWERGTSDGNLTSVR